MSIRILILALATSLLAVNVLADDKQFSKYVDENGKIELPNDIRVNLQHLGSWYVPEGGASGFHDVFTESNAIQYYQKHQSFPDATTIVKELRGAVHGNFSTGENIGYSEKTVKQWFVMIKDTNNRFSDNPNWGDGWGWALFKPGVDTNQSTDYKKDCLGCHVPAKETDWIYTQAYPVLSE